MKKPAKANAVFSSKKRPEKPMLHPQTVPGRSLRVWQRMIGAAFLCLLLVAVAMFHALPAPGKPERIAASAPVRGVSAHSINYYFQSGQWRADMRTLAAMFHYLMTPDTGNGTGTNRAVMPA